jgi:hypothetical protein
MNLKIVLMLLVIFEPSVLLAETLITQKHELTVEEPNLWSYNRISEGINVCWENPKAGTKQQKQWVKNAIQRTWEKESLVKFSGWKACNSKSKGIRIQIADTTPHTKGLGTDLDGKKNGMVLNFLFNNWNTSCRNTLKYCIESIAVHEFGHALSFSHEHNRSDNPVCGDEAQGTSGGYYVTENDLDSIMNYCNPKWNGDGTLSSLDIRGVRWLYGAPGRDCFEVPCKNDWMGPPKDNGKGGHWGSWYSLAECPKGSYAFSFRQKVEPPQGDGDDTALNAVRLLCKDSQGKKYEIHSGEGDWGYWSPWLECKNDSYFTSYQLRIEKKQGKGDDTSANDIMFKCSDGNFVRANDGGKWGDWQEGQRCNSNEYIAGFRTRIERKQGDGDDTAMNDIDVTCRKKGTSGSNGHFQPNGKTAGGSFGQWYHLQKCKNNTYAYGYVLRVEAPQDKGDDTALNGIRLYCKDKNGKNKHQIRSSEGGEGYWGKWGAPVYCPAGSYLTSYNIKVEGDQKGNDDTVANDIKFRCSDNKEIHVSNGGNWGNWKSGQYCKNGYVCGFRTKVEAEQGDGDDTALNDFSVVCCK